MFKITWQTKDRESAEAKSENEKKDTAGRESTNDKRQTSRETRQSTKAILAVGEQVMAGPLRGCRSQTSMGLRNVG